MIEIGAFWGNASSVTTQSICRFVDWLVMNGYGQYGEQIVARSMNADIMFDVKSADAAQMENYISQIGFDNLWIQFHYNARYITDPTVPKWPDCKLGELVAELEVSATRAAHLQDADWPSIDLYSGVEFKRRVEPMWGEKLLGWQFTAGGDGRITDMGILERELVKGSPRFVEIRKAIESIFSTRTEIMAEFS